MSNMSAIAMVAVIALVTAALRFLPFLLLRGRQTPPFIAYLGKVLPFAIMGMLVIYCLRGTTFTSLGSFAPQAIAVAVTAALHLWRKNTLLSVLGGTAAYMLLVQFVF